MESSRIRCMEHLAINSPMSLQNLCSAMRQKLDLPEFSFDSENETEWGLVEHKGVEYNVSRPYKIGTLQQWDETVPPKCNFGITLIVSKDYPLEHNLDSSSAKLVQRVGHTLADLIKAEVYYHRTWIGVGKNVKRKQIFSPRT